MHCKKYLHIDRKWASERRGAIQFVKMTLLLFSILAIYSSVHGAKEQLASRICRWCWYNCAGFARMSVTRVLIALCCMQRKHKYAYLKQVSSFSLSFFCFLFLNFADFIYMLV